MMEKLERFLSKYEKWILILLFILFISINIQGLSWGLPSSWHPDELVKNVDWALKGDYQFDQEDFYYPSLPKYVMYGLGKIIYGFGYPTGTFYYAARFLTVILGGLVVLLTYSITRAAGGKRTSALLASLLIITCSEFSMNAHLAHNDIYVTLFCALAVLILLKYRETANRLWLYAAFFTVGLAASSKYNGGTLLLGLYIVYLLTEGKSLFKNFLRSIETLFIASGLCFLGFALGTPKALTWMAFYFKRVAQFFSFASIYNVTPESQRGWITQWGFFINALGMPVFILLCVSILGILALMVIGWVRKKQPLPPITTRAIWVLIVAFFTLEIPLVVSYVIQMRYLLLLLPILFSLAALFIETIIKFVNDRGHTVVANGLVIGAFLLTFVPAPRMASMILLLENDARIPAGEFIASLPEGKTLEFTLYPPNLTKDHFSRSHQYPIYIKKFADAEVPTSPYYVYNRGEAGLDDRQTDYLVIDSFTYLRFNDPYTCEWNQVECDFFKRLLAGETKYQLIASFEYDLPGFLPSVPLAGVNPDILIYERQEK